MAGWPGALSAILSLFTLVGLSLLFRELPVSEAGLLALVISLSDILSLVSLLGIGTVTTRLYAASPPGTYNWPADLVGTMVVALPIVAVGSAGIIAVYDFSAEVGLYLPVVAALGTLLAATYSMLNSQGRYGWSAFLVRAPHAAFLLPGLAGALTSFELRLSSVLLVYLVSTSLAVLLAVLLLRRILPAGERRTSPQQRLEGVAFMATAAADLIPEQGLVAVAGRILPLNQVAAFAAMAILIRPFRLLRSVLTMILGPDLLRYRRDSYRRLLTGVWGLALACGIAALVLAPPVAERIYGGRYQEAVVWIPYLALAGVLQLGLVPPRSDLGVRAPVERVNRFAIAYVSAMLLSLALSVAGMREWGAQFLGPAVVLLQFTETGIAYGFWLEFRRSERNPAAAK